MSDVVDFPYVINGVAEEDIGDLFFGQSLGDFDTQTLLRCRLVSQGWKHAIDSNTALWDRMSLFKAVGDNRADICELIVEHAKNKNPSDNYSGNTALHKAAQAGHFEIFKVIANKLDDKNPKSDSWLTPLHAAARQGYFDICQFILENVDEKNPSNRSMDTTPFHEAAKNGHVDICRLFINTLDDKNPKLLLNGETPLHRAAENGHYNICQLIMELNNSDRCKIPTEDRPEDR